MKLTRLQICVIVIGIALIGIHVVPIAEAHPVTGPIIKEGFKHLKDFSKALVKIFKTGEINAAHKSVEKAIQKIKDDPLVYGLAAVEAANIAKDGTVTIIEILDSTAYDVKFQANDDDQCLDIYVNNELNGVESYAYLANITEEEVTQKLKEAAGNAIKAYQKKHPHNLV